jgi:hypothetical protein
MDTRHPLCVRQWLIQLVSVGLALTITTSAQSAGTFQGNLNAVLEVADLSGGNLQLLNFITDDGTDPNTTFAAVSPLGSLGSSASAAAAVDLSAVANNAFGLSATVTGLAAGVTPGIAVSAVGSAQAGGGFFLVNQTAAPIEVSVTFSWSWVADVFADNDSIEYALLGIALDYYEDGLFSTSLVNFAMGTPPSSSASDSALTGVFLTVAPFSERNIALIASTSGVAESVQAAEIPEPQTAYLLGAGLTTLILLRRRRWLPRDPIGRSRAYDPG